MSKLTKLVTVIFIFFICFMAGGFITYILANANNTTLDASLLTPDMKREISFMKLFQFISSFFTFILPSFLIAKSISNNAAGFLKLNNTPDFKYYILIYVFMLAIMPVQNVIIELNSSIVFPDYLKGIENWMRSKENANQDIIILMISGSYWSDLIINIVLMAIVPAIGEELIFRGIIQKYLSKLFKNHHISIIVTAIIFSAIHFQFYGFFPRMLLGIFFGYLVYYTGSLFPAIFAHFANNIMAVIAYFFVARGIISNDVETIGTQASDIWYVIIGIVIAVFTGIYLFRKKQQEKYIF